MEKMGILYGRHIVQHPSETCRFRTQFLSFVLRGKNLLQHCIHISLKRHHPADRSLKMVMIWSRSPAFGPVIEKGIVLKGLGQVQNIHVPAPYLLGNVDIHRHYEMAGENGIWIDQYIVFLSLAAVKTQGYLHLGTVLRAKETLTLPDGLRGRVRSRRDYARRIVLQFHIQASNIESPDLHRLERTEISACQRPS